MHDPTTTRCLEVAEVVQDGSRAYARCASVSLRPAPRRGARPRRRERRRQVDPDQGDHRRLPGPTAARCATRAAGAVRQPARRAARRDLHDLPGGQPRPADERGAQPVPRPRAAHRFGLIDVGADAPRGRTRSSPATAWTSTCAGRCARSASARSRWSPSPAPSSSTRGSSSWTSRRPRWSRARCETLFGVIRRLRDAGHRDRLRQPPAGRAVRDLRPRHRAARRQGRAHRPTSPSSTGCGSSR